MIDAYVGIGANLGDARATVEAALGKLAELPQSKLVAQSSLFASAPIDAGGDDRDCDVAVREDAVQGARPVATIDDDDCADVALAHQFRRVAHGSRRFHVDGQQRADVSDSHTNLLSVPVMRRGMRCMRFSTA